MLSGNGEWRWIQARGRVSVRDANGRPVRAVGTHTDITARKRAEAELVQRNAELLELNERLTALHATERSLKESQTRFRLHSDAMPLIVWSAEPDGTIDYSNRHFFDYTGVSPAQPPATRWQPCVHPDDLARCLEVWSGCVASGEQHTRDGRKLIIEGRWTLVRGADDQPLSIFAINTDITERKQIEAQFFRAQRLESIGTLAGGIAHDLNNVLAPILMWVSRMERSSTASVNLPGTW